MLTPTKIARSLTEARWTAGLPPQFPRQTHRYSAHKQDQPYLVQQHQQDPHRQNLDRHQRPSGDQRRRWGHQPGLYPLGSNAARGGCKQEAPPSDGDMWTCFMKLFRVVILKRSRLRHWLKASSSKDVSATSAYTYSPHSFEAQHDPCIYLSSAYYPGER